MRGVGVEELEITTTWSTRTCQENKHGCVRTYTGRACKYAAATTTENKCSCDSSRNNDTIMSGARKQTHEQGHDYHEQLEPQQDPVAPCTQLQPLGALCKISVCRSRSCCWHQTGRISTRPGAHSRNRERRMWCHWHWQWPVQATGEGQGPRPHQAMAQCRTCARVRNIRGKQGVQNVPRGTFNE